MKNIVAYILTSYVDKAYSMHIVFKVPIWTFETCKSLECLRMSYSTQIKLLFGERSILKMRSQI